MTKQVHEAKSLTMLRRLFLSAAVLLLFALVFAAPAVAATTVTTEVDLRDVFTSGGEVTLGGNIALTDGLEIAAGKTVTLDLNGYSLSYSSTETTGNAAITNKGTLTIMDRSEAKTGNVTYYSSAPSSTNAYGTNTITNCGTLILENGTIENNTDGGSSCAIDIDTTTGSASVTINDGKVVSKKNAIRLFTNHATHQNSLTVNGGEINGYYAIMIHLPSESSEERHAAVAINGGTLKSTDETYNLAIYSYSFGNAYSDVAINIAGGTIDGNVAVGGGSGNGGTGAEKVTITGGTITDVYTYMDDSKADITISGGTFTVEPIYYLAEDVEYWKNDEGTYTVGLSIADFTHVTTVTYDGTEKSFDTSTESALTGFTFTYSQNAVTVTPIEVGTYNVTISRAASDGYAPFNQEFTGGLVINPASDSGEGDTEPTTTYAITIASNIQNGTISADKTNAVEGETVTITAVPEDGYKLSEVSLIAEGSTLADSVTLSGNTATFEMPAKAVTVTATFTKISSGEGETEPTTYAITIEEGIQHGTISADKTTAAEGETVTITAVPENGYRFSEISLAVDGSTPAEPATMSGNTATFKMPAKAVTVSAVFTLITTEEGDSGATEKPATPGTTAPEVPAGTLEGTTVGSNTATINPPTTTTGTGEVDVETSTDGTSKTVIIDAGSGVTIKLTGASAEVTKKNDGSVDGTFNTVEAVYDNIPAGLKGSNDQVSYDLVIPMDPAKALGAGIPLPTITATFNAEIGNKVANHNGNSYNALAMIQASYSENGKDINAVNGNIKGEITITFTIPATYGQKLVVFHVKDGRATLVPGVHVGDPVNGKITVTAKGTGFSSYVVAQDTTPTSSGSSTPQGSSVWLTESQTPTPTETPTDKPTDSVPTDVPTTQPTATETQTPGFGVLAVLAGLGAVAVLRRK